MLNSKKLFKLENPLSTNGMRMRNKQLVYLIECNGLYKIGISADVNKRVKGLQTGSPHLVTCVAYYTTAQPAITVEKKLHKLFDKYRMIGEWFDFEGRFTQEAFDSVCPRFGMEKLPFLEDGTCSVVPEEKPIEKKPEFGRVPLCGGAIKQTGDSIDYWRRRYGVKR